MFEPGIELIKRTFDVVSVDGGADYRKLPRDSHPEGFRSGKYIVLATEQPRTHAGQSVSVGTRTLHATSAQRDDVTFEFADLCDQPVGAADVAQLTNRFRSWRIEHVPRLTTCTPEAAQRFVNFVDVLCDVDVRLVVTSRWTRDELVRGDPMPPDLARLESRLALLPEVSKGSPPS